MTDAPQFEVIPLPGVAEEAARQLPAGSRVTVTASGRHGLEATLATARELSSLGFTAIPHLAARQVPGESALETILTGLESDGIGEVFVIAGDAAEPAGSFTGASDLLAAMAGTGHGFTAGVGAHPEGHPFVDEEEAIRLLQEKAATASYLVTQMCFSAQPLLRWTRQVREHGIELPVRPGVAAPTGMKRLLRIAGKVGVGPSLRLLGSHRSGIRHLLGPGSWSPDALLTELAPAFEDPALRLEGLHVYTFNSLETTGTWWAGQSPEQRRPAS
ncbi:methylenetetrahydrofolate reductase [Brachybacterium sp. GCM10030267]|uniref:methylenetetrahydrofolate reductase n=1 Tax=Brachybacterium sp. GCM10030267 TaxID=3273381 RepID=UPI0036143AB5